VRRLLLFFSNFLSFLPLHGCDFSQPPLNNSQVKKELLLYCSTIMAPALREMADMFEQSHDCIVKIISDNFGVLDHNLRLGRLKSSYIQRLAQHSIAFVLAQSNNNYCYVTVLRSRGWR
jgi:hypothetical protein